MSEIDTLESPEEIEKDPAGVVRRWILELKLADKREKTWRAKAEKVWDKYRQKETKKHSFNILWPNTETQRQAVYNSLPKPDVRRRFKDEDELGKQMSTVLSRALEYGMDTTDFDSDVKSVVLDMLLPGRGVARVRYVPSMEQVGVTPETHKEENEQHEPAGEALEGESEEVSWEQAPIEHVQWDDFRILCAAKTWAEVTALGFRHRLCRDELVAQFGDIGREVKLDSTDDDDISGQRDERLAESFQTAEVWEIWDKDESRVLFICQNYKESPLKVVPDPLNLMGFWPIPKPLYAVEDSSSLVPKPLYIYYQEQADELNRISVRINKLTDALKHRGIYDATLKEMSQLMDGDDNQLIPAENVTALLERGGLEKAIWFIPIEQAAQVLVILNEQREKCKQIIHELTGLADIMRAASDPRETYGAQKLKTQWGSQRLQRMQREVQRFIRDLIRLQAEIISEKFSPETLATMTGVKLPRQAEVEQQYAMLAQQAQMQRQPPPTMPQVITWEAVIQALRDDKQRSFKIDIETDSTIAATMEDDMEGLTQVLTAVFKLIEGAGPAVMSGAMPIEVVKELIMTVCRRAKMGNAVEDALDKMKQPNPPPDPNAGQAQIEQAKLQATQQIEQAKVQSTMQIEQMKATLADQQHEREVQRDMQLERWKQEQQAADTQHTQTLEAQKAMQQAQLDAAAEERKAMIELQEKERQREFEKWKTEFVEATKITVAEISAKVQMDNALLAAETAANNKTTKELDGKVPEGPSIADVHKMLSEMVEVSKQPKPVERGPDGKAVSVGGRPVLRGPDGKIAGLQ